MKGRDAETGLNYKAKLRFGYLLLFEQWFKRQEVGKYG